MALTLSDEDFRGLKMLSNRIFELAGIICYFCFVCEQMRLYIRITSVANADIPQGMIIS
jgi:hypothetical protein